MKISTRVRPFRPNFLKKLPPLPERHISSAGHGKAKSITRPNHIRIEAVNHPSELIHSPPYLSPPQHPFPNTPNRPLPYTSLSLLSPSPTLPFPLANASPPPSTSVTDDAKIPERLSSGAAKERPNPAKKRNLWILDWKESPARWAGVSQRGRQSFPKGYGQGYPGQTGYKRQGTSGGGGRVPRKGREMDKKEQGKGILGGGGGGGG